MDSVDGVAGTTTGSDVAALMLQIVTSTLAQSLLLAYVVLMSVLLLNTLIASMNDTYSSIAEQAEDRWVLEQARIIRSLEGEMDWK